ncbi:hypothetical protein F5Y19DRAFT_452915 [Xylariaceae sp. FL1651]|nr:hypothetical protein F5Y19DRAFT_452915 [Xylariaceae sp. FL1651]
MQFKGLLLVLTIAALGAAENTVEADDVPRVCLQACQFTIDLTARCDRQTDDDDQYRPCVCGAVDSQMRLTECATCVKDNGRSDPDDNDAADLMDDCGWDFNDANAPYTTASTSTTVPSVTSATLSTNSDAVTTTQTSSVTSVAGTITNNPASTPTNSMAGAPMAKAAVGPLLSWLIIGLPVFL